MTDAQVWPPLTSVGSFLFVVVLSPSWPLLFSPQQYAAPAVVTSQVSPKPALTDPAWVSLTVTAAVVFTDPEVAVIVADPSATEVSRPADETVTIPVFDDDHVTVGPAIVLSFASFTVAVTVVVPPIDMSVSVLGDTSTVDAT